MSPYSKPNGVTNVVHDHTSVLATIEAKWNLPALTFRDANAATVMDFLDPSDAALLQPPVIEAPAASAPPDRREKLKASPPARKALGPQTRSFCPM